MEWFAVAQQRDIGGNNLDFHVIIDGRAKTSSTSLEAALFIPADVQRQLIVSDDIGPFLDLGQVCKFNARRGLEAEFLRGQDPSVPSDNSAARIDENRVGPSKFLHAGCDLCDLVLGMGPGISRVRHEIHDGSVLHTEVAHDGIPFARVGFRARFSFRSRVCSTCHHDLQRGRTCGEPPKLRVERGGNPWKPLSGFHGWPNCATIAPARAFWRGSTYKPRDLRRLSAFMPQCRQ